MPQLDPRTTALVLIDLQNGIVGRDGLGPHAPGEVVDRAKALAERCRAAGAPVVLVHVGFTAAEMPSLNVDKPSLPADGTPPAFSELVDGLRQEGDIVVLKHHWGAFIGTDLDLQLRRRGVKTIVLAGIATNMGVESTLRSGWELSYDMVVVEDACTSRSAEMHNFVVQNIFPAISRVCTADDIAFGG
ncbi:MAG: hydrolase [Sphingomonas sp.]